MLEEKGFTPEGIANTLANASAIQEKADAEEKERTAKAKEDEAAQKKMDKEARNRIEIKDTLSISY